MKGSAYKLSVQGIATPAPLNFTHTFEGVDYLVPAFTTRTSGSGRVRVTGEHGPYAGTRHLVLDSAESSQRSAAEVTLYLNTTGYRELSLAFRQREFNDESHALASEYRINNPSDPNQPMINGDGVAVSFDGNTYYRIVDLSGAASADEWRYHKLDLDAVARQHGAAITSVTRIRFHHYETGIASQAPSDGFAFDNIVVQGTR